MSNFREHPIPSLGPSLILPAKVLFLTVRATFRDLNYSGMRSLSRPPLVNTRGFVAHGEAARSSFRASRPTVPHSLSPRRLVNTSRLRLTGRPLAPCFGGTYRPSGVFMACVLHFRIVRATFWGLNCYGMHLFAPLETPRGSLVTKGGIFCYISFTSKFVTLFSKFGAWMLRKKL